MSTATSTPRPRSGRGGRPRAQRAGERLDRGVEALLAALGRVQVDEQRAQRAHAAAADAGAAAQGVVELAVVAAAVAVRGPVGHRLQLVGDAGEVLDDAVVELGRDPAALALE